MTGTDAMPKYDGMEYEDLVSEAQFLWMENEALKSDAWQVGQVAYSYAVGKSKDVIGLLKTTNAQLLTLAEDMLTLLKACHGDAIYGPYGAMNRAPTGDEIQRFVNRIEELKGSGGCCSQVRTQRCTSTQAR